MARMRKPVFYLGSELKEFPTYQKLKTELKKIMRKTGENITVFRSRRGRWGEWYEKWALINDKPKIVEEGWM